MEKLPPPLRKLWDSPAVFFAAFAGGFVVAFGVGALALWGGPDVEALLAEGKADEVLTLLSRAELSPEEHLWRGHALSMKGDREDMLRAYQAAIAGGVVDDKALENALEALGNENASNLAVKTLEDWPDATLDERLAVLANDGSYRRRHAALQTLKLRPSASEERRLRAAVVVAVTDVRADVCEQKAEGLRELAAFVELPAAHPHLKAVDAWKAVYDQNSEVIFQLHPCLDKQLVKRTDTALGALGAVGDK